MYRRRARTARRAGRPRPVARPGGPRERARAGPGAGRPRGARRERAGWYSYDWAMSVFTTTVTTVFLGPYLTVDRRDAAGADGRLSPAGHRRSPPGSCSPTCCRASVLLQVLVLPLVGRDRRPHRAQAASCWRGFAYLGALRHHRRCSSSPTTATCSAPGCSSSPTSPSARRRRLLLVAARPRRARRAGRRLQPRLGLRLRRRRRCCSPSTWRCSSAHDSLGLTAGEAVRICLAVGRPLVGRVHRRHAVRGCATAAASTAAAAPARRSAAASASWRATLREHAALPADAVVPRRLPALQRRRPDRHRAVGARTATEELDLDQTTC